MDENKQPGQSQEKDFVSGAEFQKTVRKTKLKQLGLYILISILSIGILIAIISIGGQFIINKKIEEELSKTPIPFLSDEPVKGAGIESDEVFTAPGFLSVESKITYYKKVGDRRIVWDIKRKKYPIVGDAKVISNEFPRVETYLVGGEERTVRYNHLNNERQIDFYYPVIGYNILPQELEIATGLDENTLIEVALSFHEALSPKELGERLGYKNVGWLWIDQTSEEEIQELKKHEYDFDKVLYGEKAYGISISGETPYPEFVSNEYKISGAVISGTPQELERFQDIEEIRTSVIGLTIDKY
ncbi:hypothetical protein ACFSTA_20075 [Ornithinibacillus salinisoli]|uniref:Sigma factor regulator C-terminal domain-containing protein n=1 Tax=Ornithinibacillus salinisoli TaxID=1848459 RepID=A0ABW4W896_9BACI